jgi:copper(I)-binding protein
MPEHSAELAAAELRLTLRQRDRTRRAMALFHPFANALLVALVLLAAVAPARAQGPAPAPAIRAGDLLVERPWTRATPPGARVAGGYLRVTNTGTTSDRLTGGSFDGAERVEIHEMATVDGVMRMRPLANGVEIKPGETVELRPGGLHVMFMGLSTQLRPGAPLRARLVFERAGAVDLAFEVQPMGAGPPAAARAGGAHHHH